MTATLIALLVLLAVAAPAWSQTPEQKYLAARDAYIQRFNAANPPSPAEQKRISAQHDAALLDLENQLRAMIGALVIKGMPPQGKISLESLEDGIGFGMLDGLVYRTADDKTSIVVTTKVLLTSWLNTRQNAPPELKVPPEPDAAFRDETFYTQAISADVAVVRFLDVPLGVAGTVTAMLGGRTQDNTPNAAGELFVAALRGERAFVAITAVEPPLSIEACLAPRAAAEKVLQKTDGAAKPEENSEAWMKRFEAARERIEGAFKHCFAERAPREPRWPAVVKIAKDLVKRVPAR